MNVEPAGGPLTVPQAGCLLAFAAITTLWIMAEFLHLRSPHSHDSEAKEEEMTPMIAVEPGATPRSPAPDHAKVTGKPGGLLSPMFLRLLCLEHRALLHCRLALRAGVELGAIMLWFYVADRTDTIASGLKTYIRDLFLFIFVILTLVAATYTMKKGRGPLLINRAQTEEWKGWMQVLFLLYHYYEAREAYNAIRVFIASYVWMTGYGNFSYYYRSRDFSLGRFAQMMWRLNMLVILVCCCLNNSYMLYYICPMHTLFTVMVYASLGLWRKGLDSSTGVWLKIFGCVACVIVVWEIQAVFYTIWSPFVFLMGYNDPRRPTQDLMHEWYFRSGLDRYIWIYGMVCAYVHPVLDAWLKRIDEAGPGKRFTVRAIVTSITLVVSYVWYESVFRLPKLEYNKLHPFTSWIPITCYLILRNMTPNLRVFSMGLYQWLGCITLETYIGQYHTWLLSKIPDGQPIYLMALMPGYPLLNFCIATAVYVFLSHRLFNLTSDLKDAMVPHDDDSALLRNLTTLLVTIVVFLGSGFLVHTLFVI